jgi:hypothetical protein
MSWSEQVIKGGEQKVLQPRIAIYGPQGVGKSSFCAALPKPVVIDYDKGLDYIKVDRIKAPSTWENSLLLVRQIAEDPRGYESLVIDTMEPLEDLAIQFVLQKHGKGALSDFDWGAGYNSVAAEWKIFLNLLDQCRAKGMLVCLVGHAQIREATDPQVGNYDQFTSQLGKKCWALTQRWTDLVGFVAYDSAVVDKEKGRVIVTGKRWLYTVRGSGFEAKNRFSMPPKLDLSWLAVKEAIDKHRESAEVIVARIKSLANGTEYANKASEFLAQAGSDVGKLLEVEYALKTKLSEPKVEVQAASTFPVATTTDVVAVAKAAADAVQEGYQDARPKIRIDIMDLAWRVGGDAPEKAKAFMTDAGEDLVKLLQIKEALEKKSNGQHKQAGG